MCSTASSNVTRTSDTAVLFSGGWDSLYCYAWAESRNPDLLFFDYGQPYLEQELTAVTGMRSAGASVQVVHYPPIANSNGIFDNRNLRFLEHLAGLGYKRVYFGSRNLLPIFDKYGDSNWWFGKQQARRLGIEISMPATVTPKFVIISACRAIFPELAKHVFSTEGLS